MKKIIFFMKIIREGDGGMRWNRDGRLMNDGFYTNKKRLLPFLSSALFYYLKRLFLFRVSGLFYY